MTRRPPTSAGFTLVEMIMVIVITGIISAAIAVFIRGPVEGYIDSVRRAELSEASDVAVRRMARDVRLALPNSLRVSGDCIEFIATSDGGRYRDESLGGNFLSFTSTSDLDFEVLGQMPSVASGDHIVVLNFGTAPADAYSSGTNRNRALVDTVAANTITLTANPFANQAPPLPSPGSRFQVVPAAEQAVSYVCSGGELRRYRAYGFSTSQPCPPAGTGALLVGSASTRASCQIDYTPAAFGRNGLLYIQLTLTDQPTGEAVQTFYQVHIDNTP